jgi:hypothetical protein
MISTDPVQDAIAAGVLITAILGYRNGRRINTNTESLDVVHDKLDVLNEVHGITNNGGKHDS